MKRLSIAAAIAASLTLAGAAQAATQCFDQTGTFGAVSVTITGSGCIQSANYNGQPTIGNMTSGECILTFSKPLARSSFTIDVTVMGSGDANAFVLNGGAYALQPADVSASPVFNDPVVAVASGGQLVPGVGGSSGARVVFGAGAPASVTTLQISQVSSGGGGSPYRVCADDADAIAAAPVPTMTEWAMILFGTLLAGGAALYIERRRQFS